MKKALLVTLFFIGISAVSFSQSAGKGSSEKSGGGFFSKMFHKGQKPHQQMSHFVMTSLSYLSYRYRILSYHIVSRLLLFRCSSKQTKSKNPMPNKAPPEDDA